jgi:hypothetical protein
VARNRKSIALEEKLDVIKRYKCNEHMVGIANAKGLLQSTLRAIRKQAEKTKESYKGGRNSRASKITPIRALSIEKWLSGLSMNSSIHHDHSG